MKKLLLIGLCLFALSACNKNDSALQGYIKENLKGNKGTLKLSAFKDVSWDKVYILGPFTIEKMFNDTLKPYAKEIMKSGIETDDQLCLIMLFNGNKLVGQATFDRRNIDLAGLVSFGTNAKFKPFTRDRASFVYKKSAQYAPYVLHEF